MIYFSKCILWRSVVAASLSMLWTAGAARADQSGDFTYTDNGTTITITGYSTTATNAVVIPADIVGKPVTAIAATAFLNRTTITSVVMPNTLLSIGDNAFQNCQSIDAVTWSTNLTSIGNNAFYRCLSLTALPLPAGLISIGNNAFFLCQSVVSVTIPSSVTTIGTFGFGSCLSLTSATLPQGVTTIATGTFSNCAALQTISIPSSVLTIQSQAFLNCTALATITIPPNTTTIGSKAFSNCQSLQTIAIPATVTSISTEVFTSCRSLTAISVSAANATYSSAGGVLFNKAGTTLIAFPPGVSGNYYVPVGVKTIGAKAFYTCAKLVSVTLPPGLLLVESQAFSTCTLLLAVHFTGNAPILSPNAFQQEADAFAIYYPASAMGYDFDEYPWDSLIYPAFPEGDNPFAIWLNSYSQPPDSDPYVDSNGDGVNLLMAYALNLDPGANLLGMTPVPTFAFGQATLSYWSGALGITYRVEWSTDLQSWSTSDVVVSGPDENQMSAAVMPIVGQAFFVRLVVVK